MVLGTILTLIGAAIFGSGGTTAGFLAVHHTSLADQGFYWSWPLFIAGTCLAWAILWMMD
jgi:hypothetical protein